VDKDAGTMYANRVDELAGRQAFAEWLAPASDLGSGRTWTYDYYATLTLADPRGEHRLGYNKPGMGAAKLALRNLRRIFDSNTGVAVFEMQRNRGVPHVHALIESQAIVDTRWMNEWFWDRHGMTRIEPYDASLGAVYYLGKYLFKDDPTFEVWGLPAVQAPTEINLPG